MNFYLGSMPLNPKVIVYMLSILVIFAANSSDLRRTILAYVLMLFSVANAELIINPSLISKASLASRIALYNLLRGYN